RHAGDFAPRVADRRDRERDVDRPAVLAAVFRLIAVDQFAGAQALHDAGLFTDAFGGHQHGAGLPDRFLGGVSEQFFRALVPASDGVGQIAADDRVVRRSDDGGQPRGVARQLLGTPARRAFAFQRFRAFALDLLARTDVAGDLGTADDVAPRVADRRDRERDV